MPARSQCGPAKALHWRHESALARGGLPRGNFARPRPVHKSTRWPISASIKDVDFIAFLLPVVLSDSTHGDMWVLLNAGFTDAEGVEGVGYTYTAGRNGAAVHGDLGEREIAEPFGGEEADEDPANLVQGLVDLHYGGRGGPTVLAISVFDMALMDLKAKRAPSALELLGGFDARVPCYAGGIDLDPALDELLRQTDDNLAKGFRAIKMKVGRKRLVEDIERVKAMRVYLGDGVPLLHEHEMVGR